MQAKDKAKELNVNSELASTKVQEMLSKGITVCFVHPDIFSKIKDSAMEIHPNLRFIEHDVMDKNKLLFFEQPSFDLFGSQLFSKL